VPAASIWVEDKKWTEGDYFYAIMYLAAQIYATSRSTLKDGRERGAAAVGERIRKRPKKPRRSGAANEYLSAHLSGITTSGSYFP
jgi:hypothetical protein